MPLITSANSSSLRTLLSHSAPIFLLCWLLSLAQAQVAIHPFASQDNYTGLALAEQLERILEPALPSNIPLWSLVETNFLKPPLGVARGYLSPSKDLSDNVHNATGAQVLYETLGLDVVITGKVSGANFIHYYNEATTPNASNSTEPANDGIFTLDLYINDGGASQHFSFTGHLDNITDTSYRASKVLYQRYGWRVRPLQARKDFQDSSYRDYLQILAAINSGFMLEASNLLNIFLAEYPDSYPQAQRWQRAFNAISEERYGEEPSLSAALASSMQDLEPSQHIAYFAAASQASELPIYDLWLGILRDEVNDRNGANQAFREASRYPFGAASEAVYRHVHQLAGAEESLATLSESSELSVLWALSWASQEQGDISQEKYLLERLKQLYPANPYSYERASFIAFGEDDAVAAADNLAKALELRPESSLYWTNYGWAQYLLADYEGSITSSLKAIELDPNQLIAYYNLGLGYAVQGDFDKAMLNYDIALRLNPVVDPAGLADIEQAIQDFPEEATLHFALAHLYQLQGDNEAAASAFERFIELAPEESLNTNEAEQRLAQLEAPPASFTIPHATLQLTLAEQQLALDDIHAGDRITPVFHLYTEGFELPQKIVLSYQLAESSLSQQIDIPANVVDYRINSIPIDIPHDITAGDYILELHATSNDGRSSQASLELTISEAGSLVRQLLARGILLRNLETWKPYYRLEHLYDPTIDAHIVPQMLQELRDTAQIADENLPTISLGKFAGMSGSQVFAQSSSDDVLDFLHFAAISTGEGIDIAFVEAYAQWVLEGAPARPLASP